MKFQRERLELADGDFLDLDWSKKSSKKLVIVLAGLEGKSRSMYARSSIKHFNDQGWDALGLNYRGCSGAPNRLLKGYHMGASEDDPWHKCAGWGGRAQFQMDLGCALTEAGIRMDCPNVEDLKDKKRGQHT